MIIGDDNGPLVNPFTYRNQGILNGIIGGAIIAKNQSFKGEFLSEKKDERSESLRAIERSEAHPYYCASLDMSGALMLFFRRLQLR